MDRAQLEAPIRSTFLSWRLRTSTQVFHTVASISNAKLPARLAKRWIAERSLGTFVDDEAANIAARRTQTDRATTAALQRFQKSHCQCSLASNATSNSTNTILQYSPRPTSRKYVSALKAPKHSRISSTSQRSCETCFFRYRAHSSE